jgi:hypothetical protein
LPSQGIPVQGNPSQIDAHVALANVDERVLGMRQNRGRSSRDKFAKWLPKRAYVHDEHASVLPKHLDVRVPARKYASGVTAEHFVNPLRRRPCE